MKTRTMLSMALLIVSGFAVAAFARSNTPAPAGKPEATVDLATAAGINLVKGQWRYSDTRIVEVDFRAPGPDRQPTGPAVKTYDYTPHAGGADFDDSNWEVIDAITLDQRRATGRLCFNWYRLRLTIPERVGGFETAGSTVV